MEKQLNKNMDKKIAINNKKVKKIFFYLLLIINIVSIYFLYNFINHYAIETFNADADKLISERVIKSNNLNTKNFKKIIKTVEEKDKNKEFFQDEIRDIFN